MAVFALAVLVVPVVAVAAWVRLAPTDAAHWHVSPSLYAWDHDGPWDEVLPMRGGASLRLSAARFGAPADLLARLDDVAMATPRTTRLAGRVADGRITWETRSALWGFPDYTTAETRTDGLYVHARLRFGRKDMGVNAARLTDWLARLGQSPSRR